MNSTVRNFFVWSLATVLMITVTPAKAQQPKKIPRIGVLSAGSASAYSSRIEAFRHGLRELDYTEGNNIFIEYRYADAKEDRLPGLAAELVRLNLEIIVVGGGNATLALKNATKTIPIVMTAVSDPVGTGLVASLARPGGNITGSSVINPHLSGKRLELLKETISSVTRVAVLTYRDNPAATVMLDETESAARLLALKLQIVEVSGAGHLENAFDLAKRGRAEAVNVLSSAFFTAQRKEIVELAARNRLPAMYVDSTYPDAGGLMSYGASTLEMYRRGAYYVDKILKGARPADFPVEQPTKFELVINLKTAKQIGVTIPQRVLARADRVIK